MAKLNNLEQQQHQQPQPSLLSSSTEYGTPNVGSASINSMGTTFPSNHHLLLVRHAAIEIISPAPPSISVATISHSQHQLNSGNSFEMNGGVSSLSEDSGLPLTTNSSISSGDSTRISGGLGCKFEFELAAESDAEVSQYDSLENCSDDGGMSAENFNTLKKVPLLAPIDPPPEFQDSPQTTLLRSTQQALRTFSTKLAQNIVSTAMHIGDDETATDSNTVNSMYQVILSSPPPSPPPAPMMNALKTKSLEILPTTIDNSIEHEFRYDRMPPRKLSSNNEHYYNDYDEDDEDDRECERVYQCEYHLYHRTTTDDFYHTYDIYASDSVLNTHIDNIYDVPCDEYQPAVTATAANASCDSILERGDQHFSIFDHDDNDDDHYTLNTDPITGAANVVKLPNNCANRLLVVHQMDQANAIHDYDMYYKRKQPKNAQPHFNCIRSNEGAMLLEHSSYSSNTINSSATASSSTNNSLRPVSSSSLSSATASNTIDHIQSKSSTLSSVSKTKTTSSSSSTATKTASTSTSVTTFLHRKTPSSILYSPLHYHANSNLSTGNRPNSRNSLNSRLSSSHNSLTISSLNKADDSIFITQAMSHDALTSRDISDFYNVPIDSDIYALPIDVIRPIFSLNATTTSRTFAANSRSGSSSSFNAGCKVQTIAKSTLNSCGTDKSTLKSSIASMQSGAIGGGGATETIQHNNESPVVLPTRTSILLKNGTKHFRGRLKYVRNNKRRKRQQQCLLDGGNNGTAIGNRAIPSKSWRSSVGAGTGNNNNSTDKRNSVPDNVIVAAAAAAAAEPKHMMLDEVKQQMMYTSLCSSSSESALELKAITKNMSSNYNGNSNSSGRINKLALSTAASCVFGSFSSSSNKHANNNNNNNNNSTSFNHNNASNSIVILKSDRNFNLSHINNNNLNNNTISANNHSKSQSIATTVLSTSVGGGTPNHNSATTTNGSVVSNSKLPKTINHHSQKNATCNIKKISSAPSIAKECNSDGGATTQSATKKSQFSISLNLKQKFCSIFRFRKSYSTHHHAASNNACSNHRSDIADYGVAATAANGLDKKVKFSTRALPPLPPSKLKGGSAAAATCGATSESPSANESNLVTAAVSTMDDTNEDRDAKKNEVQTTMDFAANIEKVKEYGWYWGPISSEAAEKILSNEPDGSFIVRDSSDDHYIFSLTFKLNSCIRHVRIEQDQGTFSFGSCAKFKSRTIMEFIENAVESSRSGRYLFFFHRRPEHGPMRVQLTNPVSRFKHIQSLQHMCRFVIRRAVVRKDLIQSLPLPRRLLDYLSYKNCYSEQVESDSSPSPSPSIEANEGSQHHSDEAEEHVILR